jgi:hypothetical protein
MASRYTAATIEWIAVYDKTSDRCYYISSSELGSGRDLLTLRLVAPKNCQRVGIRWADDYRTLEPSLRMEPAGFEPATSSVQGKRSPN